MSKRLTPKQIETIIKMKESGFSSRHIAKQVIGRASAKSTVNDVYNRYKEQIEQCTKDSPRILIFDVEFAPDLSYHFGRFKVTIQDSFVVETGFMLSFAAKWVGSDEIVSFALPYYDEYKKNPKNDYYLVKDLYALIDQADIIIAYNGRGYDEKVMNTRFLFHGMTPPSPYKSIDPLATIKYKFKLPRNNMDTAAKYFGLQMKMSHEGAGLWRRCLDGDPQAWKTMVDYNVGDIETLEQIYFKTRAWDDRHPNITLWGDNSVQRCVCCGSENLVLTDKKAYTGVSSFKVYRCEECGKHNRSRFSEKTKEQNKNIVTNVNYR